MGLVDDDRVVGEQLRVRLDFRQQDAVGHDLDVTVIADIAIEADLVADGAARFGPELGGNARRHPARRDTPRLGVSNKPSDATPDGKADLGQLCGFARACLAANDGHLMIREGGRDLLGRRGDGQIEHKRWLRQRSEPPLPLLCRTLDIAAQARPRPAGVAGASFSSQSRKPPGQPRLVRQHAVGDGRFEIGAGHPLAEIASRKSWLQGNPSRGLDLTLCAVDTP